MQILQALQEKLHAIDPHSVRLGEPWVDAEDCMKLISLGSFQQCWIVVES